MLTREGRYGYHQDLEPLLDQLIHIRSLLEGIANASSCQCLCIFFRWVITCKFEESMLLFWNNFLNLQNQFSYFGGVFVNCTFKYAVLLSCKVYSQQITFSVVLYIQKYVNNRNLSVYRVLVFLVQQNAFFCKKLKCVN